MLYDAPSAFMLYKAILFSIHNSRIVCFRILLFYYVMFVYKLAYTETLKIKIISNLQNENARSFFCSYQSTRSLANQNACFKSCFYVKAASLSYDDIISLYLYIYMDICLNFCSEKRKFQGPLSQLVIMLFT